MTGWRDHRAGGVAAGAALCAVPLSIAVSESFLAIALVAQAAALARRETAQSVPRVFWFWLPWVGLEILAWLLSPQPSAGIGEVRHLLLIAAVLAVLPAIRNARLELPVWRGIFFTATAGSVALIAGFVMRTLRYRHELSIGGDPGFYLRSGGFLHHWMIFATVEIVVFAALLEFHAVYPEARRWTRPALALNCLAILVSLTRGLWLAGLLVLALHLIWRRSHWVRALPLLTGMVFFAAPNTIRARLLQSFQPDYYSNTERIQMVRVGWRMIEEKPLTGVGPGRIDGLYTRYLSPGDPVPAFHGHLHNNAIQLAAEFGVPALGAALIFLIALIVELRGSHLRARDREQRFLSRAGLLGLAGFLTLGMLDYTYGHSLGLIILTFATALPLLPKPSIQYHALVHKYEHGHELAGITS